MFSKDVKTSAGLNESKKILDLPTKLDASPVYFLSLKLRDADGKALADNFYWLSAKPDVLDFKGSEWYFTPNKAYADFSSLNKLSPVEIQVEQRWKDNEVAVTLKNPGQQIAFFIELRVAKNKTGRSILPVFWDDNYVSLLPGETKQLTARFSSEDLQGEKPVLVVSGWNVRSCDFSRYQGAAGNTSSVATKVATTNSEGGLDGKE